MSNVLTIQIPASSADRARTCRAWLMPAAVPSWAKKVTYMSDMGGGLFATGDDVRLWIPQPCEAGDVAVFRHLVYQPRGNLRRDIRRTVTSIEPIRLGDLTPEQCSLLAIERLVGFDNSDTQDSRAILAWNETYPEAPWEQDRFAWILGLEDA